MQGSEEAAWPPRHQTQAMIARSAKVQMLDQGKARSSAEQRPGKTQGSAATVKVQLQAALQKHMRFSCTRSASRVKAF